MRNTIYAILNAHAKRWWWHAELRKRGQLDEARRLERRSIRDSARTLRAALATLGAHVRVAPYGWTIAYAAGCTLSGGGGEDEPMVLAARALGLPYLDTRPADESRRFSAAWNTPLVAVGRAPDPEPWHGLSYAPLAEVARRWQEIGAIVENIAAR